MTKTVITAPSIPAPSNQSFGFTMTVFFGLVWLVKCLKTQTIAFYPALPIALIFCVVTLIAPRLLTWPNKSWMRLGVLMQKIISPVVLAVIYFGIFTPFGLAFKILGKDPLKKRFETQAKSYWIHRDSKTEPQLKNQF